MAIEIQPLGERVKFIASGLVSPQGILALEHLANQRVRVYSTPQIEADIQQATRGRPLLGADQETKLYMAGYKQRTNFYIDLKHNPHVPKDPTSPSPSGNTTAPMCVQTGYSTQPLEQLS